MDFLHEGLRLLFHTGEVLPELLAKYGHWFYLILFAIVFCETGLVVTPLLPGDSLLFVAGTLAAAGGLDPWVLIGLLICAAVCGDTVNYHVGAWLKDRALRGQVWGLNPRHLARTHEFFERHGGKAVIAARFVPIVRTYSPFVAGLGAMPFRRFIAFCIAGAFLWVGGFVTAGYLLGNVPFVRTYLSQIILVIVLVSVSPAIVAVVRQRLQRKTA